MVFMQAVDFFCLIKIGKRAGPQLSVLAQLALLMSALDGLAFGTLTAFSFRVNVAANLNRDQSLHVSNIGECTGQVAVLRIAPLKMLNSAREKLQRFLIMPLPANHPAMRGID